jgi:hypothetical protein
MAHHLIDDSGRDAGVLEPGREGVAKVVGTVEIDAVQERVGGSRQRHPLRLVVLAGVGNQVGRLKFGQGSHDGACSNRPATRSERVGELVGGLRAASPERLEDPGGGRPQLAGRIRQFGQRRLVGAVEVVARQHGAGALWDAAVARAAWAATRAGEHQVRRVAPGRQLAADGLDHQGGQGELADTGVALGPGFEAAAKPAGLVAGVHDLEQGHGPVQLDAAATQPGQLPEPQPGAEQAHHVVPPEQGELREQPASLLRSEGPPSGRIQHLVGIDAASGRVVQIRLHDPLAPSPGVVLPR